MDQNHPAHREAFQLERLILFSDAVFAIAITLLVIEIKVPELHGESVDEIELLRALFHLLPKMIGFIISFVLIGQYWAIHHRLFGHIVKQTPRLITLNFLFLFTIVLMPFSTGVFGEYSTPATMHLRTPLILYALNVGASGMANFLLWRYVAKRENGVAGETLTPEVLKVRKLRALLIPTMFLLVIPVAFFDAYVARYIPILIPVVVRIASRLQARADARQPDVTGESAS